MNHILYKTTNLLNGRFYIGMHSTKNIDDGYLGSGRRIKAEIKKYGRENFVREVLEVLDSRELLGQREAEVVTEELITNPLCLNLKNGGEGGGKFWSEEHKQRWIQAGNPGVGSAAAIEKSRRSAITKALRKQDPEYAERYSQRLSESRKGKTNWLGKTHTEESKRKTSAALKGKRTGNDNPSFGSCWVTDGVKPIKIRKDALAEYEMLGYRRGRK